MSTDDVMVGYGAMKQRFDKFLCFCCCQKILERDFKQVLAGALGETKYGKITKITSECWYSNLRVQHQHSKWCGKSTIDSSPLYIVDGFEWAAVIIYQSPNVNLLKYLKTLHLLPSFMVHSTNSVAVITTKSGKSGNHKLYNGSASYVKSLKHWIYSISLQFVLQGQLMYDLWAGLHFWQKNLMMPENQLI